MATLWFISIIISIVLTMMIVNKFNLSRLPYLIILNILCPFAGMVYALYVVHVVIPRLTKKETGQEVESPLQPHIEHYMALAKEKFAELTASKDDDKTIK